MKRISSKSIEIQRAKLLLVTAGGLDNDRYEYNHVVSVSPVADFKTQKEDVTIIEQSSKNTKKISSNHNSKIATIVLVGFSKSFAKEMTMQLLTDIPGASVLYAQTAQMATWLIKRSKIDQIIVSADIIEESDYFYELLLEQDTTEFTVVGKLTSKNRLMTGLSSYQLSSIKHCKRLKYKNTRSAELKLIKSKFEDIVLNELGDHPVVLAFTSDQNRKIRYFTQMVVDSVYMTIQEILKTCNNQAKYKIAENAC